MIRVIDIETTGPDPAQDHIIEIASIDITREGFENPLSTLVRPPEGVTIPPEASAVHHIIDADITMAAPPLSEALRMFEGADMYVAHAARFESGFLPLGPWICTHKCALRVWPDAPGHSNQVLRYWLGLIDPLGWPRVKIVPHRALSDTLVTGAIFHRLLKEARYADLVQWSQDIAMYPRFTFGKNKGLRIADVEADYLRWIIDKADQIEDDWRQIAGRELQRRRQLSATGP